MKTDPLRTRRGGQEMETDHGMIEPICGDTGREIMRTPDEVTSILELQRKGWGVKRIAHALGISKNTVKRYLRANGWQPYGRPSKQKALDPCAEWVAEQYLKHRGNADVVRQELLRELGLQVSCAPSSERSPRYGVSCVPAPWPPCASR